MSYIVKFVIVLKHRNKTLEILTEPRSYSLPLGPKRRRDPPTQPYTDRGLGRKLTPSTDRSIGYPSTLPRPP